jgi:hypothetical protein
MKKILIIALVIIAAILLISIAYLVLSEEGETWVPSEPFCGDGICNGDETHTTCPEDCPEGVTPDPDPSPPISLGRIQHYLLIHYTDGTQSKLEPYFSLALFHKEKMIESMEYYLEAKANTDTIDVSVENYGVAFDIYNENGEMVNTYSIEPTLINTITVTTEWSSIWSPQIVQEDFRGGITLGNYHVVMRSTGNLEYYTGEEWKTTNKPKSLEFDIEIDEEEIFLLVGFVSPVYE